MDIKEFIRDVHEQNNIKLKEYFKKNISFISDYINNLFLNKSILDNLSEDENGVLLYKNKPIATEQEITIEEHDETYQDELDEINNTIKQSPISYIDDDTYQEELDNINNLINLSEVNKLDNNLSQEEINDIDNLIKISQVNTYDDNISQEELNNINSFIEE